MSSPLGKNLVKQITKHNTEVSHKKKEKSIKMV